jgi:hypothetical protein
MFPPDTVFQVAGKRFRPGDMLAGGWRGVVWVLRGDLEYFANTLHLDHFGSLSPCFLCKANCDDNDAPWSDCRPEAAWRSRLWTKDDWYAAKQRHIVFDLPGVSILNVMPDIMHTKHLGCDQYLYGSVLYLLTHDVMAETPADNLERIWVHVQRLYKELDIKNRICDLKLSMYVRPNDFPKLKAKAANVRAFGQILLTIWEDNMDVANPVHRQIRLALKLSARLEELIEVEHREHHMDDGVQAEFAACIQNLANLVTSLANHYHGQGRKVFHFTIKMHSLMHFSEIAKYQHPRSTWCYSGEGFMQVCKKIAISCIHGSKQQLVSKKATKKFYEGIAFGIWGAKCWR